MNPSILFKLGRISNLPTVWSNVLLAIVVSNEIIKDSNVLLLIISFSFFYIGGMFLNDAFDSEIDAIERPERPIPSGKIKKNIVLTIGFILLIFGLIFLFLATIIFQTINPYIPLLSGFLLCALIVFYNLSHKNNPLSPLIMGLCRVFIYLTTIFVFSSHLQIEILLASIFLLSYLIGLTYIAKQENVGQIKNLWPLCFLFSPIIFGLINTTNNLTIIPFLLLFSITTFVALFFLFRRKKEDIKKSVIILIAGISLFDALLIAVQGNFNLALIAVLCFILTILLQKFVPGT